ASLISSFFTTPLSHFPISTLGSNVFQTRIPGLPKEFHSNLGGQSASRIGRPLMKAKCYFLLLILFCMPSCTARYYAPNQHNAPLLKVPHDLRLSASSSSGNDVNAT